jgi:hypothetical protein
LDEEEDAMDSGMSRFAWKVNAMDLGDVWICVEGERHGFGGCLDIGHLLGC